MALGLGVVKALAERALSTEPCSPPDFATGTCYPSV